MPFRFGVNIRAVGSRAKWRTKCREAESLGFDVIGVPDHLGLSAPLPAVVSAAEATDRVRLNTFVLNVPFYNPTLLARDVATVDVLTDGRFELGLGDGYVESEFADAGMDFPTARERVDAVRRTATRLRELFTDPSYRPQPSRPGGPPLMIAGWGERMLDAIARHADIAALTGAQTDSTGHLTLATEDRTAAKVAHLRERMGHRETPLEINMLVQALIGPDDEATRRAIAPHVSAGGDDPGRYVSVLVGTPAEIADTLRRRRAELGINYLTVLDNNMRAFAPLIELLR